MASKVVKSKVVKPSAISKEQQEELNFLKKQELQLLRDAALNDLWIFATQVLWPDTSPTHYQESLHRPICEWISKTQRCGRKLLLVPREHRKTYLVTIAHAVWRITKDPDVRIFLISALDDTASYFCQMVKRQFQLNENYLRLFPEMRVGRNSQFGRTYDFTHPARTNHQLIDPTFRSFYLGAPVAGRRCDILICDDPIEKRHVTTPEQADKALKDFNDLIPTVDHTSKYDMMFIVGTRWAFNDIYGALLGEYRGEEAQVKVQDNALFDSIVRHSFEDAAGKPDFDKGTPIFDKVFTREAHLRTLEQYRADPKRGEEDWWKQYMNVCISPSGMKFEEVWFDTWVPQLPPSVIFSFVTLDTAAKDEQILMRGDYTVGILGHFDAYGHLYLMDGFRSDRMRGADIIREMLSMCQRCANKTGYAVYNILKEKVGEDTFFGWLRSEFDRAKMPLVAFPLKVRGQGKKYVRIIEALQHPAMARQIHFVTGFPRELHKVVVDEATHIGQWSHDDAIDAVSLAYHPDVRVRPTQIGAQPWVTRGGTRLQQLSTGIVAPGATMMHNIQRQGHEAWLRGAWGEVGKTQTWRTRHPSQSAQRPSTGITRVLHDKGKVHEMDPATSRTTKE